MAEYGNGEGGKFNEDGSFIGLYGRDRVQTYIVQYDKNDANNTTDPSKPYSTFVWIFPLQQIPHTRHST